MANFPNEATLFNPDLSGADALPLMQEWFETTRQLPGASESVTVTIADGNIVPQQSGLLVDTEGQAPADDLTTISVIEMHAGAEIYLSAASPERVITVRHSATALNGVTLAGGADRVLTADNCLVLKRNGDRWIERSINSVPVTWGSVSGKPSTFPPSAHSHSAANITSGLLATLRGGTVIGKIDLLPFRPADLASVAPGWYFCNGDQYATTTAQGKALAALPANFRTDWGIKTASGKINLPNLFYTDGRGLFLRAVDGTKRRVGSVEQDVSRTNPHHHGIAYTGYAGGLANDPGSTGYYSEFNQGHSAGIPTTNITKYDPRATAPVEITPAKETTVLNTGMTPAIFLGV